MFFVWRCAMARTPLVTGFWACAAATTERGSPQRASSAVPSMDLILESPVKGMGTAAEFCIEKPLPSRPPHHDHAGGTASGDRVHDPRGRPTPRHPWSVNRKGHHRGQAN